MTNYSKETEKAKIIIGHALLIQNYQKTGILDRQTALEKYKLFNARYPEYNSDMCKAALVTKSLILIDKASDFEIVNNLRLQLVWLQGKS